MEINLELKGYVNGVYGQNACVWIDGDQTIKCLHIDCGSHSTALTVQHKYIDIKVNMDDLTLMSGTFSVCGTKVNYRIRK